MTFQTEIRDLHGTSGRVELYTFDATLLGGQIYHLTPHWTSGGYLSFGGIQYSSFPLASDGWELSSTGTFPRPTIQVSNVTGVFLAAVIALGDLVGTKVTRFFTFEQFLNGSQNANDEEHSRKEIYYIEQKLEQTSEAITFQLTSPMDRSIILPRQQFLRDDVPGAVWAPGLGRFRVN